MARRNGRGLEKEVVNARLSPIKLVCETMDSTAYLQETKAGFEVLAFLLRRKILPEEA